MSKTTISNAFAPRLVAETVPAPEPVAPRPPAPKQSSRIGMKAITVYHPEIVHRTLKVIAAEEGRTVEDMTAEALNLLFAKYEKPEVARSNDAT